MRKIVKLGALAAVAAAAACAMPGANQPEARASADRPPVTSREPYVMKGTVQSVGEGVLGLGMGRAVTISRQGAPPAVLNVEDGTRVTVDGRAASVSELRPGDEVRATFDLDGDDPVAIEIEVEER